MTPVLFVILSTLAQPLESGSKSKPVRAYADVELKYTSGTLTLERVRRGTFAQPTALRRFRGRFEAQSVSPKSQKVCESARFDFPLLADAETEDVTPENRRLAGKLRERVIATTTVRVPLLEGCDLVIVRDSKSAVELRVDTTKAVTGDSRPAR